MRKNTFVFTIVIYLIAAIVPFIAGSAISGGGTGGEVVKWPVRFEGRPLQRLRLSPKEEAFSKGFPGEIARFTDGRRELVIRHVVKPTRKLHPASDCLRGAGYTVAAAPLRVDARGGLWGCVTAEREGLGLRVCERIFGSGGRGFQDSSSWFWSAVFDKTEGPWLAVTLSERI